MSKHTTRQMYGYETASDNQSTQRTDEVLVAAAAGKTIVVDYVEFNTDTAMNAFFEHGTTQLGSIKYMGANGGFILDDPHYRCARGAALTYTTSANGNTSVYVEYHYE